MHVNQPNEYARWADRIERLWRDAIPLAAAMGARIGRLDGDALVAVAPLAANVNHMGTAFGGGLQALATLAGWAVTLVSAGESAACRVVVRDARMRFLAPVRGDLEARAAWPVEDEAAAFRARLAERGRARLTVRVRYGPARDPQAEFEGEFVAFLAERSDTDQ